MTDDDLPMYVIYQHPSDFPDEFVCRRQFAGRGIVTVERELFARGPSLDSVRGQLPHGLGLFCLGRSPQDDPCIAEVWV
jgi:hypothetical protein